ncbi:hypothetical protein M8J77_016627 [Diaphorina citri]|nr:hypothetical protein M8J77_016627 [Diaphorina citri]
MCRRNHLREVKNAKVINGDGVAAQRRLLVMDIEMEVKKTTSGKIQREQKIKWWMLKDVERRREFKQKVLEEIVQKENVQEWWDVNSNIIRRIGSNVLGKTTGKGAPQKKETWWWNEAVQKIVKEKKNAKKKYDKTGRQEDKEAYKILNKEAKRVVAQCKAREIEKAYEELDGKDGDRKLLRIAKSRDKASKDITVIKQIKDEQGVVIRDEEKIKERWKDYFKTLLNVENPREIFEDGTENLGMTCEIDRNEVTKAVKKMKNGKSEGVDQIPVEVWKSLGEEGIDILLDLMNKLWNQEVIPDDWKRSMIVPIYKGKGDVQNCGNYRGIKLMSHTMKIWERIIDARLREETEIDDEQFGFMPGRGTIDAVFALRRLLEKFREMQRELHLVFIDLEKAYDRIPRQEVWRSMREKGVPEKYIRVIKGMYSEARTQVRSSVGMTKGFTVEVGLHQGSVLSPYLFDLIMDVLVKEVKKKAPWSMMFADDVVLCELSREEVERKLEDWRRVLEERGMRISRTKTEYMTTKQVEDISISLQNERLPSVEKFKYLSWFSH